MAPMSTSRRSSRSALRAFAIRGAAATCGAPANGSLVEFTFNPLPDGRVLAVGHDVTEIKHREEALQAAADILKLISDGRVDLADRARPAGPVGLAAVRCRRRQHLPARRRHLPRHGKLWLFARADRFHDAPEGVAGPQFAFRPHCAGARHRSHSRRAGRSGIQLVGTAAVQRIPRDARHPADARGRADRRAGDDARQSRCRSRRRRSN